MAREVVNSLRLCKGTHLGSRVFDKLVLGS